MSATKSYVCWDRNSAYILTRPRLQKVSRPLSSGPRHNDDVMRIMGFMLTSKLLEHIIEYNIAAVCLINNWKPGVPVRTCGTQSDKERTTVLKYRVLSKGI